MGIQNPYVKVALQDEVVERQNEYRVGGELLDISRDPDNVTQAGTKLNKAIMDGIQDAVIDAQNAILSALIDPVANVSSLKSIDTSDASDGAIIIVGTLGMFYFDQDSSATGDDEFVVVPNSGSGRWIRTSVNAKTLQGLDPSQFLLSSEFTGAEILSLLLTVDTDASGLNATTLQGLTPDQFLRTTDNIDADTFDGNPPSHFALASQVTASALLSAIKTVDGPDSGLDSETVSGFKFFGSVDDLGFTPGSETINGMIQAMPNLSVLNCFIGSTYNTSEYPAIGTLHIVRVNEFRTFLEFRHFNDSKRVWKGVYYTESGTGTFRGWEAPLIQGEYGEMMYESNSFTIGPGHKNKHVLCTNDTNITITVPQTNDYVAGDYIVFTRDRNATVQFVANGVTLFSIDSQRSIGNRYGDVVLKKRYDGLAGSWQLTGDLA